MERKVFTHLVNTDAPNLYDSLTQGGFRRSQNIAYRPACEDCAACVSVRVPVNRFNWRRSFNRIIKHNRDLSGQFMPGISNQQHYSLFQEYINSRHNEGGMANMTALDFSAMVDESLVNTKLIEYRFTSDKQINYPNTRSGILAGVALSDILDDGLSMIYSFYDPELNNRSLGTYMILDHIRRAEKMGLPYVYLGYWIKNSTKMDYKKRFLPQERLSPNGWKLILDS